MYTVLFFKEYMISMSIKLINQASEHFVLQSIKIRENRALLSDGYTSNTNVKFMNFSLKYFTFFSFISLDFIIPIPIF